MGYVEYEKYCQKLLKQRIKDGLLDVAPIFGDIRKFNSEGYAESYQGLVDVITGGFPCQPFSVAGRRRGENDERNMWPPTLDTIRIIRPLYAFLENVPGLISSGYFERILCDLAQIGYDVRWTVMGASDVGAPHQRKRLWIVAHSKRNGSGLRRAEREGQQGRDASISSSVLGDSERSLCNGGANIEGRETEGGTSVVGTGQTMADTPRIQQGREKQRSVGPGGESIDMANTQGKPKRAGLRKNEPPEIWRRRPGDSSSEVSDPKPKRLEGYNSLGGQKRIKERAAIKQNHWWFPEPALGRVAHGVAHRVDRLKAIGNGQVPQVAAVAWQILSGIK